MRRGNLHSPRPVPSPDSSRRGVFLVVGALTLSICLIFVAFTVDLGMVSLTKTQLQNAADTAALAAAMEIQNAIATADSGAVQDVFAYAMEQSRTTAASTAQMNSVYVNPQTDVAFGRRYFDAVSQAFQTDWSASGAQVNCVKVTARRDGTTEGAPDAKLPGLFSRMFTDDGTAVRAEAVAYIEPRDLVVVHDFSRSMNFDSYFTTETTTRLSQAQIEANLLLVWNDLQPLNLGTLTYTPQYAWQTKSNTGATATVTYMGPSISVVSNTAIKTVKLYFSTGGSQTFSISGETTLTGTWAGTGSNSGKRVSSVDVTIRKVGSTSANWSLTGYQYNSTNVMACFGLDSVSYPYASGSWSSYVSFVQSNSGLSAYGYKDMYGGMTFLCYLMKDKSSYHETKDLWKTRHYPFHSIKEGHELLCDFLAGLGYDDYLGMVSYDSSHRIETTINDSNPEFPQVDISAKPLTNDYESIKKLMKYKQASHYSDSTNMSGGLKDGIALLDQYKRMGSRPAILLMTDGNSNTLDAGETGALPAGWDWDELFDYDGDGSADYTTTSTQRTAVLKYVKEAVDKGYTVHAISVGADADRDLLTAVAWLGNGYWIDVPGGSSVAEMQEQVLEAFTKIAAAVPPARLVAPE